MIERCKDLLQRFIEEDKTYGKMPLHKGRIVELMEILKNLRELEINDGILPRPGKKSHLIDLFP